MDDKQLEFEKEILEELKNLTVSWGFSEPQITRKNYSTVFDYFATRFAIEIEIDWREYGVFILIVKLEAGKLPNGYYVSKGGMCREHLRSVLQQCHVPLVPVGKTSYTRERWRNFAWMRGVFLKEKELLIQHLDAIKKLYQEG
ncbi:MAG: hypothetical protein A2Y02_00090 [Omnitrophica bacterium GWA2_52_12]|nr:MAG: hypothetical protein A2Y02_00090 [Omnitrophica bacterium GWA2_52_12]